MGGLYRHLATWPKWTIELKVRYDIIPAFVSKPALRHIKLSDSPYKVLRNANISLSTSSSDLPIPVSLALGAIRFGTSPAGNKLAADPPFLDVPMPVLDGDSACEWWLGDIATITEQHGGIRYRRNENLLFGMIELEESGFASAALQQATESVYLQVFALLDELGYPFVYRFWNYMADINAVSQGLERYRQFNLGRQEAFLARGRNVAGELPAACALGVAQGALQVAFLAGRIAPRAIENPRQVNAYDYPEDYGPRSPTFSRASLLRLPGEEVLFISGTASIVGYRTLHAGDVLGQTRETLANIEAVILEANRIMPDRWFDPARLFYRVYVRHGTDLAVVRDELNRLTGTQAHALFLQADICRDDLLLEIEATAFSCASKSADGQ